MKQWYLFALALVVSASLMAQEVEQNQVEQTLAEQEQDESGVHFAHEFGLTLQSTYLWRGQYLGGLTFEPEVAIGYDGEKTDLRIGACADLGASDWKFKSGQEWLDEETNPNTYFNPELDLYADFNFFGVNVNFTHYQYWFYNQDKTYSPWHQGEVGIGYDFSYFFEKVPLHINWYTLVYGDDYNYSTEEDEDGEEIEKQERAYSSYLEIGYTQPLPYDMSIGVNIGMSPWKSDNYLNEKFAVVNLSARFEKTWTIEDVCELTLFAEGSINPDLMSRDKNSVYVNKAGAEKNCAQSLNGNIGFSVWF